MLRNSVPVLAAAAQSRRPMFVAAAAAAFAAALVCAAPGRAAAPAGGAEVGIWYDDTGKGAVEIKPCGAKLCGYIVWLKEPISSKTGKPLVDANNPEALGRSRPICGLQILGNLARQSDGSLDDGWVYDPKVGKSYDAALEVEGKTQLKLTGYKGVRFLGKSFIWNRAPDTLPRCAGDASAAPAPAPAPAR